MRSFLLKIEETIYNKLRKMSFDEKISIAEIIRRAINEYFKNRQIKL